MNTPAPTLQELELASSELLDNTVPKWDGISHEFIDMSINMLITKVTDMHGQVAHVVQTRSSTTFFYQ